MIALVLRDEEKALEWLNVARANAEAEELDAGLWALMGIKYNFLGHPVLEQPQSVEARSGIRGR